MEIRFSITEELINEMEAEEYEAFERAQDGDLKMYRLRPAMCRFMVDENNIPVPHKEAMKIPGKLKIKHYKDFVNQFFEAMQNKAVPKESGSPLELPIEVNQMDSLSHVG